MLVPSKEWSRTTGRIDIDITCDYPQSSTTMPRILVMEDRYGVKDNEPGKE